MFFLHFSDFFATVGDGDEAPKGRNLIYALTWPITGTLSFVSFCPFSQ
jgi:hypothetical protein